MRVLVLGASGFIGRHLVDALALRGDDVVTSSLRDPVAAAARALGCEAIVNLAGEPVAQRWNRAIKERIASSRTEAPRKFLEELARQGCAAHVYVSASGVGYYGVSPDATFVEESPPGSDFLAEVCAGWEEQAMRAHDLGMRSAVIRTGIVLSPDGGALAKMLPPFRMGVGGPLGSGRQWFSWIHVDDAIGIYLAALDRGEGAYNATAPHPLTNRDFARELGRALNRPAAIPTPYFALRLVFGEAADQLVEGQRALPKRTTEDLNYEFRFPRITEALHELFHR